MSVIWEEPLLYDELWAPKGELITEQIIINLLNTKVVKRLKKIGQNGVANHVIPPINNMVTPSKTTRFDHSCGTMLITRKAGGTIDEQVAALLHDLPHSCFSHTIDVLVDNPSESYHEVHKWEILEPYIDELNKILDSEWKTFVDAKKFDVVKMNKKIAADVADYLCRDAYVFQFRDKHELQDHVNKLIVYNKPRKLCCISKEEAIWWRDLSLQIDGGIYNSAWNIGQNKMLAEILKEKGIELKELLSCFDGEKKYLTTEDIDKIGRNKWEFGDDVTTGNWQQIERKIVRARVLNPYYLSGSELETLEPEKTMTGGNKYVTLWRELKPHNEIKNYNSEKTKQNIYTKKYAKYLNKYNKLLAK